MNKNKGKMKHNLNEGYLQSLTEEERTKQMREWSPAEWQQYYCSNGTTPLDDVMDYIKNKACQIARKKYGNSI